MGILSKGLTKLLKPEVGPLGGPSKKVRNPIVKPRVDTTKTVTRDINFDIEDRESIDKYMEMQVVIEILKVKIMLFLKK